MSVISSLPEMNGFPTPMAHRHVVYDHAIGCAGFGGACTLTLP